MADPASSALSGGFLPPQAATSLPSPAPSGSSTTTTRPTSGLPHPRAHPLRAGSAKEEKIRIYVENQLMTINRRFVKKFETPKPGDEIVGYRNAGELCHDVEGLLDVLWLSGTPTLQIPYLLNIANDFPEWLTRFPLQPPPMFSLFRKLDYCFASLLCGHDIDTREPLPGFEHGVRGVMTKTHMVRCKSIVDQTRVLIVEFMSGQRQAPMVVDMDTDGEGEEKETDMDTDTDTDAHTDTEMGTATETETDAENSGRRGFVDPNWEEEDEDLYMDVARIYERTLVQLGEVLQNSSLP